MLVGRLLVAAGRHAALLLAGGVFAGLVLRDSAAAFALNLGFQAVTPLLFHRAGARTALSLGLISGNRNMALVFAVTGATQPDLLLYLAVAQVPIYRSPLLTKRLYGCLLRAGG